MSRARRFPVTALVLIVAGPLAWFACGGGAKPADSPADNAASSSSEESAAASDTSAAAASAPSASAAEAPSATATAEETAAAAPPPPSFGSTDCGACIDKTCSKAEQACGKNADCQTALDAVHGCTSGAATCIDAATAPSAAKPKKLAAAYKACAKKAVAKACKAKCQ